MLNTITMIVSKECKKLQKQIRNLKQIEILIGSKGLLDNKQKLSWWADKETFEPIKVRVNVKYANRNACDAFKLALSNVGVTFEKDVEDGNIFHSSRWRKYYTNKEKISAIFVFILNREETDQVKKIVTKLGNIFVPTEMIDQNINSIYRKSVLRASKGNWWKRNWKQVVFGGTMLAIVAYLVYNEWKRTQQKELKK